ncbi:hypothetical protein FB451DRAFT_407190 [Mycena latifolia]|nr:hypothetical protein FB451DRAFT_407190 [Mycena latifolia]
MMARVHVIARILCLARFHSFLAHFARQARSPVSDSVGCVLVLSLEHWIRSSYNELQQLQLTQLLRCFFKAHWQFTPFVSPSCRSANVYQPPISGGSKLLYSFHSKSAVSVRVHRSPHLLDPVMV